MGARPNHASALAPRHPNPSGRAHAASPTGRARSVAGALGSQADCRSRPPLRSLRPVSYRSPRALVTLSFSAHEALGRLALLRLASALTAPWRLLMNLARRLRAGDAGANPRARRRREPYLSAALRKVRAT